ncbi:MAG: homocysteine S-methyltransferase family protein, partial [Clostridiales bacterium]|nr:homocysteine S-methyltransferase family protein [Clostridiales bacterium]
DFLRRIQSGDTLIFDGGMGSMLAAGGAGEGAGLANLSHPFLVKDIHIAYLAAGAECLITNTLTLNAAYMKKIGLLHLLESALYAGIEQALSAADGRAYVLGDMGPAGELLAPYGSGDSDAFYDAFCRQAAVFAEARLSGIIIETVFSWDEAKLMLAACHDAAPSLPVILSMTFANVKDGGRTIMGDKAADIASSAGELGACAVGTNCGDLAPKELVNTLLSMAPAGLPLIAQPNAGTPILNGKHTVYDMPPEDFALGMLMLKRAGAQMLGGCCGTTPAHIAAIVKAIKKEH